MLQCHGCEPELLVQIFIVLETVERSVVEHVAVGVFEDPVGEYAPPVRVKVQVVGVCGDLDLVQKAPDGELLGHAAGGRPGGGQFYGHVSGHRQETPGKECVVLFRVLRRQARENAGLVNVFAGDPFLVTQCVYVLEQLINENDGGMPDGPGQKAGAAQTPPTILCRNP
jgi:hypothetical protein